MSCLRRAARSLLACAALAGLGSGAQAMSPSPFQATPALINLNGSAAQRHWVGVGPLEHRSWLRVPGVCQVAWCGLVVISHPRGQNVERLRDSISMDVMLDALLHAGYAVLLSSDGGLTTWGSPQALKVAGQAHREAVGRFHWNGKTYAMGYSMGGLTALRSTLPGSPYQVQGLILIDAWVNLKAAWSLSASRRSEIRAAYPLASGSVNSFDPLPAALKGGKQPMLVMASVQDKIAPAHLNGAKLYAQALAGPSSYVKLSGPHLGGNRFTPDVARNVVAFLTRLTRGGS